MKSTLWITLALALTAVAGCTEGEEAAPALTEEDCAELGLVLGHKTVMDEESSETDGGADEESADESMGNESTENGTEAPLQFPAMRQAGNETGNETELPEEEAGVEAQSGEAQEDEHNHGAHGEELACVPAGPVATVSLSLPSTTMAFIPVDFNWVLNTEAEEELHTMDTQVRVSMESVADADLGMPDTFGDLVAQFEHQNFFDGQSYNGSFETDMPGNYYFRAYSVVNGENLWSEEMMLNVTEVVATGVTSQISCSNGGAPSIGSCTPSTIDIELGDAIAWLNGNQGGVGSWDITVDGAESFTTTAGGDAVVFLMPGSYTFDAEGDLGTVSGSINVLLPSA